mmetsp:Transcript_4427/g.5143  ORF Transcript_4427/g.5143 Transcript_4427/m.5143 type:complete len:125 (+) Transcript_4427:1235-1609(+)
MSFFKLLDKKLHYTLVKVFTTKMGISVCGQNFEHAVFNREQCHIKSTPTKIEHENVLFSFVFIQTIRNCRSSWFIDNTHNSHTRNGSCIFGCLTLRIVKVSWNSNYRVGNFFSKVTLCCRFHFL